MSYVTEPLLIFTKKNSPTMRRECCAIMGDYLFFITGTRPTKGVGLLISCKVLDGHTIGFVDSARCNRSHNGHLHGVAIVATLTAHKIV